MTRTYEELVQLRQDNRIGWLQFTLESEHADDYMQWCREHDTHPSEETAEFYIDMTEQSVQDRQLLEEDDYEEFGWN
ncbi:MAG: hypothetical protein ACTTJL_00350 [Hoylesella enoeca]|uniref:hypothetical protein n=1 Tax=Prevotellaceae TaxID=171552 RepID=UPI00055C5E62|nr:MULTISPECIES: hypothetical protein [Prevotellaceae]